MELERIKSFDVDWLKADTLPIKVLLTKEREMRHGVYRFDESFMVHGLPMSPTVNKMYATSVKYGRSHRFKTRDAKDFEHAMRAYYFQFKNQLDLVSTVLQGYISNGYALEINRYFFFQPGQLLTKKFTAKKMDVSNRIKALDDEVSKMISIDDKFFFHGTEGKVMCNPNTDPFISVIIGPCMIKDEVSFYERMSRLKLTELPDYIKHGTC